jgi:hypothetical protein
MYSIIYIGISYRIFRALSSVAQEIFVTDVPMNDDLQLPWLPIPVPTHVPGIFDGAFVEVIRRALINETLLQQARDNFERVSATAETPYSADLKALQVKLNNYLQQDPSWYSRVVVLDPAKLDAAMAIGFKDIEAVRRVLDQNGLKLENNDDDNYSAESLAKRALHRYETTRFGFPVYTTDPASVGNIGLANPAYVIVPEADHAQSITVEGMTSKENTEFTNRHEAWHTKDSRNTLKNFPAVTVAVADDYDAKMICEDPELCAAFVTRFRKEALADVGAVGDMIREKGDMKYIDLVSKWRAGSPDDDIHYSSMALAGLKTEIEKMGLDKFRAIKDPEAKNFYYGVVEKYGISEKGIDAAAHYDMGTDEEKAAIEEKAKRDPEIRRNLDFVTKLSEKPAPPEADVLSEDEKPLKAEIDKWDALKILADRAFAMSGRITPATLVKAYGALAGELHDKMNADPDNGMYNLQMTKLQSRFIEGVREIDFVAVNAERGVKIEDVEPTLSQFMLRPKARESEADPPGPPKKGPSLKL